MHVIVIMKNGEVMWGSHVGKSCGPDEIHPRLLCELAEQHL